MKLILISLCFTAVIAQQSNGNTNYLDSATQAKINNIFGNTASTGASPPLEKCGQGSTKGIKMCVNYQYCDTKTNTIIPSGATDGYGLMSIRLDLSECDESLQRCCNIPTNQQTPYSLPPTGTNPYTTPTATALDSSKSGFSECGKRYPNGIDFKMVGNTNEAEYGEFPWMVAIVVSKYLVYGLDNPLVCGGSLITPNVVLTAAHCVKSYYTGDLVVRAGEWDTQTKNERLPYQERDVQQVIIHDKYNSMNVHNDIALLILEQAITKADNVGTVCLPPANVGLSSRNCFVTGWGKKAFDNPRKIQSILKKIDLPTVEHGVCQETLRKTPLGSRFVLHDGFMCAGGILGKDACTGDGGSPLVCPDDQSPDDSYFQVGIVAWGVGCGQQDMPGVYVDVAKYRSWIDTNLQRLNIKTSSYNYVQIHL